MTILGCKVALRDPLTSVLARARAIQAFVSLWLLRLDLADCVSTQAYSDLGGGDVPAARVIADMHSLVEFSAILESLLLRQVLE